MFYNWSVKFWMSTKDALPVQWQHINCVKYMKKGNTRVACKRMVLKWMIKTWMDTDTNLRVLCIYYGKYGHKRTDCPNRKSEEYDSTVFRRYCWVCGKKGHTTMKSHDKKDWTMMMKKTTSTQLKKAGESPRKESNKGISQNTFLIHIASSSWNMKVELGSNINTKVTQIVEVYFLKKK